MVRTVRSLKMSACISILNLNLSDMDNLSLRASVSPRQRKGSTCPPIAALRPTPPPDEKKFLEEAERGDKPGLEKSLKNGVNVNCMDVLGRTALYIAVDNENVEIVEILLNQKNIKIGSALLHAIREGVYRVVEMIIDHDSIKSNPDVLGSGWSKTLEPEDADNFEYSTDISPVMLAAHLNQFEILKLLKDRGASIAKPHNLTCKCLECTEERIHDSLHHSLRRIHTYRALASPAWISLSSNDPILNSFKLSCDLRRLSVKEREFKEVYLQLSEQCKSFACDLLSQCRSTEEVIAVLNKDTTDDPEDPVWTCTKLSLARLKLALKYEQKQFVAHPHCQQLLTSIWYEGIPGSSKRSTFMNVLFCMLLVLSWPFLCFCYIFCPKSYFGQIVRTPFMKFLNYSLSFGIFLTLLTLATFESHRKNTDEMRAKLKAPPPSEIECLIVIWVIGMVWSEMKQLWDEGFKMYTLQWWNWLDFIMMSLYLATISLRIVSIYLVYTGRISGEPIPRNFWDSSEPLLVSEGLFALANVFSFARIIYLFQTNPYLGPLQISLGSMMIDVAKFFFIFFLILSSFAIGMHQLYWYYDTVKCSRSLSTDSTDPTCRMEKGAFSTIQNSYVTLLWSLFSITEVMNTEVDAPHHFTEWLGRSLYVMYHVTSIIVLLNMLIAMMSHSFQIINENSDLEWKFHRSKLWMGFFDEGSSLPAPFNIIVTPKAVWKCICSARDGVRYCCGMKPWRQPSKRATIKRPGYHKDRRQQRRNPSTTSSFIDLRPPPTYKEIMERLVQRFIHITKKEMKMDGVNEDDLLEIKQDISSLRFELREERRRDMQRSSGQLDGVRREIIRSLSLAKVVPPPPKISITNDWESESSTPDDDLVVNSASSDDQSLNGNHKKPPTVSFSSPPRGEETARSFLPPDANSLPKRPSLKSLSDDVSQNDSDSSNLRHSTLKKTDPTYQVAFADDEDSKAAQAMPPQLPTGQLPPGSPPPAVHRQRISSERGCSEADANHKCRCKKEVESLKREISELLRTELRTFANQISGNSLTVTDPRGRWLPP